MIGTENRLVDIMSNAVLEHNWSSQLTYRKYKIHKDMCVMVVLTLYKIWLSSDLIN